MGLTLWSIILCLQAFQCRGEQTDQQCFRDCNPQMICSNPVELNRCPVKFTIDVNLTTDVFIYQRNISDDLVHDCSSTGSDCLVDHTNALTYDVTEATPTVPEQKTCQGSNPCVVNFYLKPPLKTTRCKGRHYVFVNYACVQQTAESTDTLTPSVGDEDFDQSSDMVGLIAGLTVVVLALICILCVIWLWRRGKINITYTVPGETPLRCTEDNFRPDTAPASGAMNDTLSDTGAGSLGQCGPGPLQPSGQEPSPTPGDNVATMPSSTSSVPPPKPGFPTGLKSSYPNPSVKADVADTGNLDDYALTMTENDLYGGK